MAPDLRNLAQRRSRAALALADANEALRVEVRRQAEAGTPKTVLAEATGLSRQTIHNMTKGEQ